MSRFNILVASLGLALEFGGQLCGQEALRNAVDGDRSLETRQNPENHLKEEGLKAGPVRLQVGLGYSLDWNDNIRNTAEHRESDFIHRPELTLRGEWAATKDSRLTFGMGIGYKKYDEHGDLDRFTVTPNSEIAWDIPLQDFQLTLYDRITRSQEVTSQGGLSGVAEFPRTENTVGFRTIWQPSAFRWEWGYSHYNFISESAAAGATNFDYLNRSAEQAFARLAYQMAEVTHGGIELSGAVTDYESRQQQDNKNISVGPYLEWQIRESLRLSLRGGLVTYFQDASLTVTNGSDLQSYYAGLDLRHKLTRNISHGVAVNREISQGVNQGGGLSESLQVNYSASWAFHDRVSVSVDGFYEKGKQGRSGGVDEYDRYGVGGALRWNLTPHFSSSIAYHYSNRDSVLPTGDYRFNLISFNASYSF